MILDLNYWTPEFYTHNTINQCNKLVQYYWFPGGDSSIELSYFSVRKFVNFRRKYRQEPQLPHAFTKRWLHLSKSFMLDF